MAEKVTKLSYVLYQHLLKLHREGKSVSPWLIKIKDTIDSCGMGHIFLDQTVSNPKWIQNIVKRRLEDRYASGL